MAKQPKSRSGSVGRLSYHPASDEGPISTAIEFVRSQLPAWSDAPRRPTGRSEKSLNSSLCDFLDTRARTGCPMVRFKHEDPQAARHTVDIGVHGVDELTLIGVHDYTIFEPFMVIEAKRLPAPSTDREREYVTGASRASGGIQRFKLGLHGAKVETAMMIGYVENENARHWFVIINQWISEFIGTSTADGCDWAESDLLEGIVYDDEQHTSSATSIHSRHHTCLTPSIRIHHLWVLMASTIAPV